MTLSNTTEVTPDQTLDFQNVDPKLAPIPTEEPSPSPTSDPDHTQTASSNNANTTFTFASSQRVAADGTVVFEGVESDDENVMPNLFSSTFQATLTRLNTNETNLQNIVDRARAQGSSPRQTTINSLNEVQQEKRDALQEIIPQKLIDEDYTNIDFVEYSSDKIVVTYDFDGSKWEHTVINKTENDAYGNPQQVVEYNTVKIN